MCMKSSPKFISSNPLHTIRVILIMSITFFRNKPNDAMKRKIKTGRLADMGGGSTYYTNSVQTERLNDGKI